VVGGWFNQPHLDPVRPIRFWGWVSRVGYRLDLYDTGAKTILLKWYWFLNGARTDTFFKIKSKQQC